METLLDDNTTKRLSFDHLHYHLHHHLYHSKSWPLHNETISDLGTLGTSVKF